MKLEHLAPYLPYKLKVLYEHSNKIGTISNIYTIGNGYDDDDIKISIDYSEAEHLWMFKPILRPLSDLTKEIEHNGKKFVPIENLLKIKFTGWYNENKGTRYSEINFESTPNYAKSCFKYHATHSIEIWLKGFDNECYWIVQKLFEWHFDVFGLIEKGEAIDINTL